MSGLDKMKSRIFEEAEQSAAELLDQAKKDAEKIVKDAVEKAGADAEHIGRLQVRCGRGQGEIRVLQRLDERRVGRRPFGRDRIG